MSNYKQKPPIKPYESLTEEQQENERITAKRRAMYLLGMRSYSIDGMKRKLSEHYNSESVQKVVECLVDYGYLDDEKYAKNLAEKNIVNMKRGKERVYYDLKMQGISENIIQEVLDAYTSDDFVDGAEQIIRKKYSDMLTDWDDCKKVYAALARRGYSYSVAKAAVNNVKNQQ